MDYRNKLEIYIRENHIPFQVQGPSQDYTAQELTAGEHVLGRLVVYRMRDQPRSFASPIAKIPTGVT